MFKNKKVIVVMPAYNAAKTLRRTHIELMAQGCVDLVIIIDDARNYIDTVTDHYDAIVTDVTNLKYKRKRKPKGG